MGRLDLLLVARGYYATRARARDAIRRGTVTVDELILDKPGAAVRPDAAIAIFDPGQPYVSRGALKLGAALEAFALSPAELDCLDIGASTGGFTQLLLERGARSVTVLDVGVGQLHPLLAGDPRVTDLAPLNARELAAHHLEQPPQFITADVSFISLGLVLPPALALAHRHAIVVALVKPQFEVGRDAISKGGIVRDATAQSQAVDRIAALIASHGFDLVGSIPSPILGGDGNREFLVAGRR